MLTAGGWVLLNLQDNISTVFKLYMSSYSLEQTEVTQVSWSTLIPAVGYAAAIASHPQAFLQVRGEAWGSNASAAVGTYTLFVFPLVVHLAEHIQSRLVHNFWRFKASDKWFSFIIWLHGMVMELKIHCWFSEILLPECVVAMSLTLIII